MKDCLEGTGDKMSAKAVTEAKERRQKYLLEFEAAVEVKKEWIKVKSVEAIQSCGEEGR